MDDLDDLQDDGEIFHDNHGSVEDRDLLDNEFVAVFDC